MSTTPHFGLERPDFETVTWHDFVNDNFTILDAVVYTYISARNLRGVWANATMYGVGEIVVDEDSAYLFECAIGNTSASTGTFLEDRTANPSNWTLIESPLGDITKVDKSGDTMTGYLTLAGNATQALHAVPKQQVMLLDGTQVMTGELVLSGAGVTANAAVTKTQLDTKASLTTPDFITNISVTASSTDSGQVDIDAAAAIVTEVRLMEAGFTRWALQKQTDADFAIKRYNGTGVLQDTPFLIDDTTGLVTFNTKVAFLDDAEVRSSKNFTLAANADTALEAVPLQQLQSAVAAIDFTPYLAKAGGTMTGALVLSGNATENLHPVTKQQLDALQAELDATQLLMYVIRQGLVTTGAGGDLTFSFATAFPSQCYGLVATPKHGSNTRIVILESFNATEATIRTVNNTNDSVACDVYYWAWGV